MLFLITQKDFCNCLYPHFNSNLSMF